MSDKTVKVAIIGGGISGLSLAYYLQRKAAAQNIPLELSLHEREERLGGKIITEKKHGFTCEGGPNGFLDNKTGMLDLARELGLDEELEPSNEQAAKRFLLCNGHLLQVPESPPAFFLSPILSFWGKIRIIGEFFARRSPEGSDETIAEFGRRHIGSEAVEKLLDPMVSGIFAGDIDSLSLRSCFPRMAELEARHGSLIRAMIRLQMQKKKDAVSRKKAGPAGPGGRLYSFKNGTETIIRKLADTIGADRIRLSSTMSSIAVEPASEKPQFTLTFGENGGQTATADAVILAVPAFSAKGALKQLDEELSEVVAGIPYAPMAVVCTGFSQASVGRPLDGFGYLIPRREGRKLLGSLWTSSIFPNRAPGGSVLLRNMIGGARDIKTPFLEDDELTELVLEELRPTLKISGKPAFVRIFRWRNAIPQYVTGHGARVKKMEDILRVRHPGLFIAGNAYRGIAMNDCVENSSKVADQVVEYIKKLSI